MGTLYAQSTGNWSAINWNTAANGSGSNQVPAAADTLVSNSYTVTVDGNYTVTKVTNTSGGTFALTDGVTLTCTDATAGVVGNATDAGAVTFALTGATAATLAAKVLGGDGAKEWGVNFSGTGTLTINGSVTGGTFAGTFATGADGVYISGAGTLVVANGTNDAIIGGTNNLARGVYCVASATITITGNVTGGSGGTAPGLLATGAATFTITGNVTGGSGGTAPGLSATGTATTITVTGNVTGGGGINSSGLSATGAATIAVTGTVTGGSAPGISSTTTSAAISIIGACVASAGANAVSATGTALLVTGPLKTQFSGRQALYAPNWNWNSAALQSTYLEVYTDLVEKRSLYTADTLPGVPSASDVRHGTTFGPDDELTGTCYVPAAASVLYGVNVDATTGTATLAAADIRAALGLSSANLDAQLSAIPTAPLLAADYTAPPSVAAIRAEMDTNSTKLDVAVSTRLAPDGTLATVTTLTNAPDVPTEAEIAAEVWSYVTRTITSGGITAQQVWEYVSATLPDGAETMLALLATIYARLEEQVPDDPVLVIPAPGVGQTTAWVMCYDESGELESGVKITVTCVESSADGAFDSTPVVLTSDNDGLAAGSIPRGTGRKFTAKRGSGRAVRFNGVDADTVALPSLLGAP